MVIKGPYNLKSLALITDLFLAQLETEVLNREGYIVFKTPSHPDYFWGNYIVFFESPKEGDLVRWKDIYREEFSLQNPGYYVFTWDSCEMKQEFITPFEEDGFKLNVDITLTTAEPVKPPRFNDKIKVRVINTPEEWEQIRYVHVNKDPTQPVKSQMQFITKRLQAFKDLVDKGCALRFGAFMDGKAVGDLGMCYKDGLARFNLVATHPDYFRQGICQTLVYESSLYVLENLNISLLVIVADENYHAYRVYQMAGFKPVQKNFSLMWWERDIYGEF